MNAAHTAHTDQLHAILRDRTPSNGHTCDAFDRCDDCKALAREAAAERHAERVEALRITRPRLGD